MSEQSDDPDRKVAAIIFDENGRVVTCSSNVLVTPKKSNFRERTSRVKNQKYFWIEHAERRAIFLALKQHVNLTKCSIAVSLFPCADCARAIIQSGLKTVVAPTISANEERHLETMKAAREILRDANIELIYLAKEDAL